MFQSNPLPLPLPLSRIDRLMRTALLTTALLAALAVVACETTTSDRDIVTISYEQFREIHDADDVVVLDVRSRQAYERGHIPGAINIPMPELAARDARLTGAARIVVHAEGPGDARSPGATKRLIALGYRNVTDFRGGVREWQEQGHDLDTP